MKFILEDNYILKLDLTDERILESIVTTGVPADIIKAKASLVSNLVSAKTTEQYEVALDSISKFSVTSGATTYKFTDSEKSAVVDLHLYPDDMYGPYNKRTLSTVVFKDVFVINPCYMTLQILSGFYAKYWDAYGFTWLDTQYPSIVCKFMHNYFRAAGIVVLSLAGDSIENIRRIVNIATGMPFSLGDGFIKRITEGSEYRLLHYPGYDHAPDGVDPTFEYIIPTAMPLAAKFTESGCVVEMYEPLLDAVTVKDSVADDKFNSEYLAGIDDSSIAKDLNKYKCVGISVRKLPGIGKHSEFLAYVLNKHIPSDLTILYKEI